MLDKPTLNFGRIITFVLVCVLGLMLLVAISRQHDAEEALRTERARATTQPTLDYERGLAAGINATMATIKLNGTNKPSIDLADTFEYARTNKSK